MHDPKQLLFYRDYAYFTGGQLKVWHYFQHSLQSKIYQPQIVFSPQTCWDEHNIWSDWQQLALPNWQPEQVDALFLAGLDWLQLEQRQRAHCSRPIINLLQHVRHADPQQALSGFLSHKAVRLCVSEQVADAVKQTGLCEGPILSNPNGLDFSELPPVQAWQHKQNDLLVVGLKRFDLLGDIELYLQQHPQQPSYTILLDRVSRSEFLQLVNQAKHTLFLPNITEGFYLPALEGMALDSVVICPDCIGNRSFCLPDLNCYRPVYELNSIYQAVDAALNLLDTERQTLLKQAQSMVKNHSLIRERDFFLDILENIDQLW